LKIAFDIDGVLRRKDLGFLKLCLDLGIEKTREALWMYDYAETEPILNPMLFATPDDEIYVITNCMTKESAEVKKRWIRHFYGDRIKFLHVSVAATSWGKKYVDAVAKAKVDIMLQEGIEVYFDNDPAIIRVMRSLTDKIKFIKYGPWIEEYY